jgi:hypothetical protein
MGSGLWKRESSNMKHADIIYRLSQNQNIFASLFHGIPSEEITWKPKPDKWNLLEIVCHLYDEEREDFRSRIKHTFETPEKEFSKIDPQAWVTERKYMQRNFEDMVSKFIEERSHSIAWLNSLSKPAWKNMHIHPKFGEIAAEMFLSNWLAHDYLHFRQITFTRYQYLTNHFNTRFDYAGNW